jgi:hypothetical protein
MIREGVSDDGISRALGSIGVEIGKTSILRHRQNHPPDDAGEPVELNPDMAIPRPAHVEPAPPMGDAAARLLIEVREQVTRSDIDITTDRLVRETLLGRIMERQLATVVTALDRYLEGEGRYPLDMIRGLSTVGTLFEKTVLHTTAVTETKMMLFEREITRLESLARDDAKQRVLKGDKVSKKAPDEYVIPAEWDSIYQKRKYDSFQFGGKYLRGELFNARIETAWSEGIAQGKADKQGGTHDENRAV